MMSDCVFREALLSFIQQHDRRTVTKDFFVSWLCEHFNTYPRNAVFILSEMKESGFVSQQSNKIGIKV